MPNTAALISLVLIIAFVAGATVLTHNLLSPVTNPTTTTITYGYNTFTTVTTQSTTASSTSIGSSPGASFRLISWNVTVVGGSSGSDSAAIGCKYSTDIPDWPVSATLTLTDPNGQAHGVYVPPSLAADTAFLYLSGDNAEPLPGTYTMTVTYEGQKVFERSFTFNGPKTSAAGISYSTYDSYLPNPSGSGNMSYIAAPGINITLRNTGDLPFYIKNINARISSTSSSTSYSMTVAPHQGWVLPQKSATATAMTSYAFQSGTYSVSVWLTDASGTQMSPGMFSIPIPSK